MSTALSLTRPQKAAAILVAMGKPSASRLLKFFKQEELKALIEAARLLRTIPQSELEKIVAEFEDEFTEGAGLLDSADKMDTILNESLSPRRDERADGRRASRASAGRAAADLADSSRSWSRRGSARSWPASTRRRSPWCCRNWRRRPPPTCC